MEYILKKATQNLYDTFGKYSVLGNLRLRSCECCVSDNEIRQLLSKPLDDLNQDDLRRFMSKAVTTYGNIQDYKHFLPRILELMQNLNSDFIDDFTTYEKLNYSEWETWDTKEIDAIDNYFLALWTKKIEDENASFYEIEGVLEIVKKYTGLDKSLKIWEAHASKKSILFIVDLVWNNYNFKSDKKTDLLYDWFSQSKIKEKIQDTYFETEDKTLATRISVVYTILDNHES